MFAHRDHRHRTDRQTETDRQTDRQPDRQIRKCTGLTYYPLTGMRNKTLPPCTQAHTSEI